MPAWRDEMCWFQTNFGIDNKAEEDKSALIGDARLHRAAFFHRNERPRLAEPKVSSRTNTFGNANLTLPTERTRSATRI